MKFEVTEEDKHKTGVYCIINTVNGERYVGSTTYSFIYRYWQHKSAYKQGVMFNDLLVSAIGKFGIGNFVFKIIVICGKKKCLKNEQIAIDEKSEYNICKVAGSHKGHRHPDTGKTRTVRGGAHHSAKVVYQFTLSGQLIRRFESTIEAIVFLEKPKGSLTHIAEACKGKVVSIFGYRWSYSSKLVKRKDNRCVRSVKVLLTKGKTRKVFASQSLAAEYLVSLGYRANQGRVHRGANSNELVYGFKISKL